MKLFENVTNEIRWNYFKVIYFFSNYLWFRVFKITELQEAKSIRICSNFLMGLGEDVLLWTLISKVQKNFNKNHFKGYLSHSQVQKCLMQFLGSRTWPWAGISFKGIILDSKNDDPKIASIFENFGKSRNYFWVPPIFSRS